MSVTVTLFILWLIDLIHIWPLWRVLLIGLVADILNYGITTLISVVVGLKGELR